MLYVEEVKLKKNVQTHTHIKNAHAYVIGMCIDNTYMWVYTVCIRVAYTLYVYKYV